MAHIKLKKLLTHEKIDQILHNEETNFFGFFIKHYRFTYLILIAIFLAGFYAAFTLPRESEPEVKIPYAMVSTVYPGANPSDTEELLTNKIEEKIKNLEDLKQYTSSSGVGVSSVFVEFNADADLRDSMQKLREAVDLAKPNLPSDAEDPMVSQLNFNDQALITYSLVGENFSEPELKYYADILQEKLEGIKDVSRAPVIGGLEREFQVVVNQSRLLDYNLSLGQIVNAIARANFNLPAGNIDIDGYKYNVRVQGKFSDTGSLGDIVIASFNDTPVYLRDVAQIKDAYREKNSESRVGVGHNAPNSTVSLQIYKKTGGNILKMVDEANRIVEETKNSPGWPETLDILKTNDLAVFVRDDFNTLGSSAIQTIILIVLILSLAIGLRASIIASASVPIAFLMAFVVLMLQDMTLNSMVLFSLVLSLGLMVDNSIIIIEGISEYMGKYGISAYKAAQLSVWNYRWPVISGTMTTVAAFAPMLLVSGILGEYLGTIPKTIMATLISSLFVALIILPTMAGRFVKKTLSQERYHDANGNNGDGAPAGHKPEKTKWMEKLKDSYAVFMEKILPHKKKRRAVILTAWAVFIISALIPVVGLMKIEMFPKVDIDFIVVNMELPAGSILDKTKEVAAEVEKIIVEQVPEIDNYVTNIGNSTSYDLGGGSSGSHIASILLISMKTAAEKAMKSPKACGR
jgi:multidrug efflux pump subunit AcrB